MQLQLQRGLKALYPAPLAAHRHMRALTKIETTALSITAMLLHLQCQVGIADQSPSRAFHWEAVPPCPPRAHASWSPTNARCCGHAFHILAQGDIHLMNAL